MLLINVQLIKCVYCNVCITDDISGQLHVMVRPIPTVRNSTLHALPRPLTSLVGREQEIAAVEALLQRPEVHLVSVVGTAGVGKTRLALQVAMGMQENFVDGVFFVALAPVRNPELVLPTIVQTLGL